MDLTEKAREIFKRDNYAMQAGCVIEQAGENYARCSMEITDTHRNAAGTVMGGAIFTLADLCFSVAANMEKPLTVSMTSQISFLAASRGTRLFAESECIKSGRSSCFFNILVTDDLGVKIATATFTGYRRG